MNSVLLSVLILASTASVRSSLAEEAAPQDAGGQSQAIFILTDACCAEQSAPEDTAARAAEQLRYDAGLISNLSGVGKQTRNQRLNAAFSAAGRLMNSSLTLDLTAWKITLSDFNPGVYDCYAQNHAAFSALAERVNGAVQTAAFNCSVVLSRDLRAANIPLESAGQPQTRLNWRQAAALYYAFGEDMTRVLAESLAVEKEGSVYTRVTMRWPEPTFEEIASRGTRDQLVEAKLALYYFNTVYLDDGTVAPVTKVVYSKEYLATIAHPVPGGTIKNGWYDPRSHRTRLHTGTDIRVRGKSPILSVTDGVVQQIGYLPIPGNYVIIRDPYGYEYHYYHMFELSTFVKEGDTVQQGQQIGRVGSTGNSVAYHLHLGLVSPDGVYLNPYDLFVQAGIKPILGE